jgi:hypothetical protein
MFDYIFDLYQVVERFLGLTYNNYDDTCNDECYEYLESNKIILNTPIIEKPIVSPILVEPMFITSEHIFVAKY